MVEPTSKFVVAVVDDDSRTLESLADLLEAAGYGVRLYSSALRAWHHGRWSEIDCLISDVGMPDMSGFELRRLALTVRPELPVILITGRPEFRLQHVSSIEPDRYFEKPFDGQQLLAAIRAALGGARPGGRA
ncbi:MAG: response regulator [Acidobacteria bacterium]|nr:response regulator [Acidobacteriota bacterium]